MYDAFIGRQAIFDQNLSVYAYELLFRCGLQSSAEVVDGNLASSRVMLNTFSEFGLDNIVGRHMAFINLTRDLLVDDLIELLPRERVVLEVLEDVEIDKNLIDAVRKLSEMGFLIALDDFEFDAAWQPLVEIADIVKLDVLSLDEKEIDAHVKYLRPYKVRLLAEKVETREQFEFLKRLGFDYYQGYFLCRPSIVEGRRMPTNKLSVLQLLSRLMHAETQHAEIERLITQDVALSYKILRFINSASFALPRTIDSIKEAVFYMGTRNIRRFASIVVMAGFDDQPHELLLTSLLRARMCELLAEAAGCSDSGSYFTTGLFSTLDVLLGMPMHELLEELPLGDELAQALLDGSGDLGAALACTLAYERQTWVEAGFAELDAAAISSIYLKAVQWSNETGISL